MSANQVDDNMLFDRNQREEPSILYLKFSDAYIRAGARQLVSYANSAASTRHRALEMVTFVPLIKSSTEFCLVCISSSCF